MSVYVCVVLFFTVYSANGGFFCFSFCVNAMKNLESVLSIICEDSKFWWSSVLLQLKTLLRYYRTTRQIISSLQTFHPKACLGSDLKHLDEVKHSPGRSLPFCDCVYVTRCRLSELDGPGTGQVRHRGGSKSCLKYAAEMEAAEKGVQTKDCLHDAFEHIHRNKDGSYTDAKSERIANQIKDLAEVMAQPLPGTTEPRPVDWNKCYLEVTGGLDHKGRLFGGGTLAKTLMSSDSAATSQIDRQEIDNRLEEMEQRLERDQEERKQLYEQLERDQEERKQLYEQVQAQQKLIQELISKSSQFAPSS